MTTQHSYEPCFVTVPETALGRWELLREFTRRWHGVSLGLVGAASSLVDREQAALGRELPPSFREYISFADELIAQDAFGILRDSYEVTHLEEHSATSLLLQCEGDVYWAVKDENLSDDDPPIDMYYLDYQNEESFTHGGTEWPTITSFVLGHMAHFLHGEGGGCLVGVKLTDGMLDEMDQSFPVASRFANIQIFEKQNVIVFVIPNTYEPGEHHLFVEVFRPMPISAIPDCVLRHTNNGGAFHGMFADRLPR